VHTGSVSGPPDLYVPFRPRAARRVAAVLGVLSLVGLLVLAVVVPSAASSPTGIVDRLSIAGVAAAVGWFCYRQATVRAVPDATGLLVRNLAVTTRVEWAAVVSVRFGEGRPWVQLDLDDGATLAVMGIQRSDGERARAEARRLATLVAVHGTGVDD
jgi:hypothetical protein